MATQERQTGAVRYDQNTIVVYRDQQYPVTALERGDVVVMQILEVQGGLYTQRIEVQQSVQDRTGTGNAGVVQLAGRISATDHNAGTFVDEGYSTMCGHATIALGRWAIESGRVPAVAPVTEFALEVPCGIVRVGCELEGGRVVRTSFESVPAFLGERDLAVEVAGIGSVHVDIADDAAFYPCCRPPRSASTSSTPVPELCARATSITETIRASVPITHPSEPNLGFLYGTILTDDAPAPEPSYKLCVFAAGQIDRSPTGSGVTARMARDHARGHIGAGTERRFHDPTGIPFSAAITRAGAAGVTVRVSGTSSVTGRSTYLIEADDPLADGFVLPHRYAELLNAPRA